ncbi:MAG: biopolymer transporter ExbD [Deltaproteobacteria bacterium]|nr:biopolymer transporter ExbD [Deltaproteobacteria bacterium]
MAMSDPGRKGLLADINVTPLVDVMLVLLIIFMISSSIETMQVQQEKQRIQQTIKPEDRLDQKVPVNLPRTDAEPVNLSEERKVVLTINETAEFYVGDALVMKCLDVAPALKPAIQKRKAWGREEDTHLKKCLDVLAAKLGANEKLKQDKEMYLRADESLPYGLALKVMAEIRRNGVAKFGLVAEPEPM